MMMKAVSTVVATLLMLIITIALAGVAYTYIAGIIPSRTGVVVTLDSANTTCATLYGWTRYITVQVRNDGTQAVSKGGITISGTRSDGSAIPSATCGPAVGSASVGAGQTAPCDYILAIPGSPVNGTSGTNSIRLSTATTSGSGTVFCP